MKARIRRLLGPCLAVALLGFAFGTGADHAQLRDREWGRPFFEPAVPAPSASRDTPGAAGVSTPGPAEALRFVDTDHGFDLAFGGGTPVARWHGDGLDVLAWESHGRPPAYRYQIDSSGPTWLPVSFARDAASTGSRAALRIEGESLWPPAAQRAGWAWPTWQVPSCASAGRALRTHGSRGDTTVRLTLPAAAAGRELVPIVVVDSQPFDIQLEISEVAIKTWRAAAVASPGCVALDAASLPSGGQRMRLTLVGPGATLDALDLRENR